MTSAAPSRLRETDDGGTAIVDGYATIYDYAYDVAGGPPYGWTETITAGAADRSVTERDDTRLLFNHDGLHSRAAPPGTAP